MLRSLTLFVVSLTLFVSALLVAPSARRLAAEEPADSPAAGATDFTSAQIETFEKQVQPILKARCLKCHGGEEKIRGGLRLTSRGALLQGGDQGAALDLKTPADSLFLKAINYDTLEMPPSGKLPPAEIDVLTRWVNDGAPWTPGAEPEPERPHVTGIQIDDEARNYWAYRPLVSPPVPTVALKSWVRNPIDAFLLSRMEAEGLTPARPADPVSLIRRVYYDLIGLPPAPEEVDRFVADPSEAAYQALVNRLLDSPQYGEKWGRHWLDLVRFAETHGYERDSPKPFAWRYRDYVIQSFNADKPYDQFLREQLAGDELDVVTAETLTATGFYRLGLWDDEPADRSLAKYDVLDGVISTAGQVMLGMSVGCARCHDHKKDPLPQRDYYRLLAFFRDVSDMNVKNTRLFVTDEDRRAQARQQADRLQQQAAWQEQLGDLEAKFAAAWEARTGTRLAAQPASGISDLKYRFYRDTWDRLPAFDGLKFETAGDLPRNLVTLSAASRHEAIGLVFEGQLRVPQSGEFTFEFDATEGLRLLLAGRAVVDAPERGRHQGMVRVPLEAGLVPVRIEYFNNDQTPRLDLAWQGPGVPHRRLTDQAPVGELAGLLADSRQEGHEWKFTESKPGDSWMTPGFDDSSWKQGPGGFGTPGTPGAVVRTRWSSKNIWLRRNFRVERAVPRIALELHHDDEVDVYLNGKRILERKGFLVAYQRFLLPPEAAQLLVVGENVLAVHCHQTVGGQYIDAGIVPASPYETLTTLLVERGDEVLAPGTAAVYQTLVTQLAASRNDKPAEVGTEIMCVVEQAPEPTHVLIRGNPGSPGEQVVPGIPQVLESDAIPVPAARPTASTSGKRRAFAEWLTSPRNPLPARVMVNRLWQFHFGRGIVPTPNDFGRLGEAPTHPELLDWLASELIRRGWRIKDMHRLLMFSTAYRMSADSTDVGLERDPGNHLFWRFPMRRLTAEEVRDSILASSGQLNLKSGGPGVYPPIPKEVLAGQSVPGSGWGNSPPEEAARRSVYVHVKRSLLVPILSQHDMADTDSSCAVRFTTTVPTQALGMLNGEFTNEQAEQLALRLEQEHPGDLPAQVVRGIRLTTGRTPTAEEIRFDSGFIAKLGQVGANPHKALVQYCLLLLNSNEFVYLD